MNRCDALLGTVTLDDGRPTRFKCAVKPHRQAARLVCGPFVSTLGNRATPSVTMVCFVRRCSAALSPAMDQASVHTSDPIVAKSMISTRWHLTI